MPTTRSSTAGASARKLKKGSKDKSKDSETVKLKSAEKWQKAQGRTPVLILERLTSDQLADHTDQPSTSRSTRSRTPMQANVVPPNSPKNLRATRRNQPPPPEESPANTSRRQLRSSAGSSTSMVSPAVTPDPPEPRGRTKKRNSEPEPNQEPKAKGRKNAQPGSEEEPQTRKQTRSKRNVPASSQTPSRSDTQEPPKQRASRSRNRDNNQDATTAEEPPAAPPKTKPRPRNKQTNNNNEEPAEDLEIPVPVEPTSSAPRSKPKKKRLKRTTPEPSIPESPVPGPSNARAHSPDSSNPLLPRAALFPSPTDHPSTYAEKLVKLTPELRRIFSLIFNAVQEADEDLVPCFKDIERVYEFFERRILRTTGVEWGPNAKVFGDKYRSLCGKLLYDFGTLVWKTTNLNQFSKNCSDLIVYCFMNLGYEQARRGEPKYVTRKNEDFPPACYYMCKFFKRYAGDSNTSTRFHQLSLLEHILRVSQSEYILFCLETIGEVVNIRAADKHAPNRCLVLKIIGYFLALDLDETNPAHETLSKLHRNLKRFTRYDVNAEVRKVGTEILSTKTRMKNRFFYDQAFDSNDAVRVQAYKAMGLKDSQGKLVRHMHEITRDKACRTAIWGTKFCGDKCYKLVMNDLLPHWLVDCCDNNLVQFIDRLEGYENMKGVVSVLDLMLSHPENNDLIENLNLSFIDELKGSTRDLNLVDKDIERYLGWLAMAKASKHNDWLRVKAIPDGHVMLELIEGIIKCAVNENEEAKRTGEPESITPVVCLCIALEIAKSFVEFEEAGKRHYVNLLTKIVNKEELDERPLINQTLHCLYAAVDLHQFDDIVMEMLQNMFEPKDLNGEQPDDEFHPESLAGNQSSVHNDTFKSEIAPSPEEQQRPQTPVYRPLTSYEQTKLKAELCEIKLRRVDLQNQKKAALDANKFSEAAPIHDQIERIKLQEKALQDKIDSGLSDEIVRYDAVVPEQPNQEVPEHIEVESENSIEQEHEVPEVITTVEDGLIKCIFTINMYLDIHASLSPLIRNVYENYCLNFLKHDPDPTLKSYILGLLCRVALIDPREVKKVLVVLISAAMLERDIRHKQVAFQGIVDLLIKYDFPYFLIAEQEMDNPTIKAYVQDMRKHVHPDFPNLTPETIEASFIGLITTKYKSFVTRLPLPQEEKIRHLHVYYTGLIRLFIRGRIRSSSILSEILCLWVDKSYSGTVVLRDLDHVLKLYHTFTWWGENQVITPLEGEVTPVPQDQEEEDDETPKNKHMMRVIGLAIGESIARMGNDQDITEEHLFKFIAYFIMFVDRSDQPLMRSIAARILEKVRDNVSSPQNALLIKCVSKIPVLSLVSVKHLMSIVADIFLKMKPPTILTPSLSCTLKELKLLIKRYERMFGSDIAMVEEHGRMRRVDQVLSDGDDDEDLGGEEEEEEEQRDAFASDVSSDNVPLAGGEE